MTLHPIHMIWLRGPLGQISCLQIPQLLPLLPQSPLCRPLRLWNLSKDLGCLGKDQQWEPDSRQREAVRWLRLFPYGHIGCWCQVDKEDRCLTTGIGLSPLLICINQKLITLPFQRILPSLWAWTESLMNTHQPKWDDCKQLLTTLFKTEEQDHIITEARNNVLGQIGGLLSGLTCWMNNVLWFCPEWDYNTPECRECLSTYHHILMSPPIWLR